MTRQLQSKPAGRDTTGAEFRRVDADSLKQFTAAVLQRQGIGREDALTGAEVLVTADLMGIDSHGVAHLGTHLGYVPGFRKGIVNPAPSIRVVHETPSTARLDADRGFGPVIGCRAMELAISKARQVGVGMVAVDNARHFGAAGYYALMATRQDMIGLAMCNAKAQVYPANGRKPVLGTNPIAVAVPAGEERPFLLDMATSAVAMGKLEIAEREARSIPRGWGADAAGLDSTDVHGVRSAGGLLPLGSSVETSSYKGYGLGVAVDILCGVLSGAGFSLILDRDVSAAGHFFGAIRVDGFRPVDEFKQMMDRMLQELRACPPADGAERVLIPGQREFEAIDERRAHGIPLHESVYATLMRLGQECSVDLRLEAS